MASTPRIKKLLGRRTFLAALAATACAPRAAAAEGPAQRRILLRSSWQTVNIGDIAHTPGMLALLEKHHPTAEITLWPNALSPEVEKLLQQRFPKLAIAARPEQQQAALAGCDFFVHGSAPGLVGRREAEQARQAGKPYGFAGITLSDEEIQTHRELLAGAKFVFTRETASLEALRAAGIAGPRTGFGPDATFALDLRDDEGAAGLLRQHQLTAGAFLCAVPRLRFTPYWEIHPERVPPNPERSAVNEAFAERDHAKMRAAIIAWVREFKRRVFLVPEMTYAVSRLRPLLFDPLPAEIKPHVAVMDRYWLTAEAASVYARAAAVLSFEMHSPIIAASQGTPAILLRQPTDTRKGQMWRDIGLERWIFEIDEVEGGEIAERVLAMGRDLPAARQQMAAALRTAQGHLATMLAEVK